MSRTTSGLVEQRPLGEAVGSREDSAESRSRWGSWGDASRGDTAWLDNTWGGRTIEARPSRWRPWLLLALLLLLVSIWWAPFGTREDGPPTLAGADTTPTGSPDAIGVSDGRGVGSGSTAVAAGAAEEEENRPTEPLSPIIGADGIARPTVRILEPPSDTLVTGSVLVRWESAAASPIESAEIHVNGRQVVRLQGDRSEKNLDMRYFDGGDHTVTVTVYDANRRKGSDRITVRVRNPTFVLNRLTRKSGVARNGEVLVIELATNGTGFVPRADLGPIDSRFDENVIEWTELAPDRWQLEYRISSANRRPDGSYWLEVSLEDREEPSIRDTELVRAKLANYLRGDSLREVLEIPCAVYRPDPVPPAGRDSPRLIRVEGPDEGRVGESLELRLQWDGAPGRERRFVRLSADGLDGHFVLHGSCGLEDTLEILPKAITDRPLRLAVWPSEGLPVTHSLAISEAAE